MITDEEYDEKFCLSGQSEGSSPSAPMHREAQNELKKSNLNTILLPKTADDYPIIDVSYHSSGFFFYFYWHV